MIRKKSVVEQIESMEFGDQIIIIRSKVNAYYNPAAH